jgi:hypothetical protein
VVSLWWLFVVEKHATFSGFIFADSRFGNALVDAVAEHGAPD